MGLKDMKLSRGFKAKIKGAKSVEDVLAMDKSDWTKAHLIEYIENFLN